ncbi:hypothetical protein EDB19DRAFT_1642914, partial [Suillus lakei]
RLPYFDLVEQIVIDPMHNLFLGLVKTHFYNIWVQNKILRPNHELTKFHEMIADFVIPSSCGKLPTDIGMPSGGSLTVDQWLLLSTVYGPIIVSSTPYTRTEKKARNAQKVPSFDLVLVTCLQTLSLQKLSGKRKATSQTVDGEARQLPPPPQVKQNTGDETESLDDLKFSLHPDDPGNFLKLCYALRILVQHLYGSAAIKPNHHYATHIADCVRNFGPLHGFWTFLFEQLNKVLKSFKTNNHVDGELETTFFHEFQQTCQTSRLVSFRCRFSVRRDVSLII